MSHPIERKIDAALYQARCSGYTARFEPSTDYQVEDSSVAILLYGHKTSWKLQIGPGYCGVNEYGYDADGNLEWVRNHGVYRSQQKAIMRLCALLAKVEA